MLVRLEKCDCRLQLGMQIKYVKILILFKKENWKIDCFSYEKVIENIKYNLMKIRMKQINLYKIEPLPRAILTVE